MAHKPKIKQEEVKTQLDKVLWHLQTYGTLTTWDAFNTYRIMRLGSIIDILRNKQNYNIETELIGHTLASDSLFPNARNGKGQHAKYIYKELHNDSFGIPELDFTSNDEPIDVISQEKKAKSFIGKLFDI